MCKPLCITNTGLRFYFLTTKNILIMDALEFLRTEHPEMNGRIDDRSKLTWNNIVSLLRRYEEQFQIKNNCDKPDVMQSCDTCKHLSSCRFWQEAPENGATCKFHIEHGT